MPLSPLLSAIVAIVVGHRRHCSRHCCRPPLPLLSATAAIVVGHRRRCYRQPGEARSSPGQLRVAQISPEPSVATRKEPNKIQRNPLESHGQRRNFTEIQRDIATSSRQHLSRGARTSQQRALMSHGGYMKEHWEAMRNPTQLRASKHGSSNLDQPRARVSSLDASR